MSEKKVPIWFDEQQSQSHSVSDASDEESDACFYRSMQIGINTAVSQPHENVAELRALLASLGLVMLACQACGWVAEEERLSARVCRTCNGRILACVNCCHLFFIEEATEFCCRDCVNMYAQAEAIREQKLENHSKKRKIYTTGMAISSNNNNSNNSNSKPTTNNNNSGSLANQLIGEDEDTEEVEDDLSDLFVRKKARHEDDIFK